eukprot:3098157-Alexandrium_andersonii.AAC.1
MPRRRRERHAMSLRAIVYWRQCPNAHRFHPSGKAHTGRVDNQAHRFPALQSSCNAIPVSVRV